MKTCISDAANLFCDRPLLAKNIISDGKRALMSRRIAWCGKYSSVVVGGEMGSRSGFCGKRFSVLSCTGRSSYSIENPVFYVIFVKERHRHRTKKVVT